ncbi:hybrid sensor histidine kinase/response regulator [Aquamicrobium sp.]|uniref:hybrid sensor histidine kinase/response regulator n=1 Tax=Aquamicrobium sp. TaxID=1872579 RepID=UPI00258F8D91|nr:hybrid sensor histidine kinase/response regulator [Aquamicrobium sp.]MCK9549242.1 ATP-binding protein [Aquamicrobium sp.]
MVTMFHALDAGPTVNEGYDTERSQAIVRVVVVFIGIAFMMHEALTDQIPGPFDSIIIVLCTVIAITSVLILLAVLLRPGVSHPRRIVGMAHDYTALTVAMAFGGGALMPLYALLLWVTLGNGFRYGPRYHRAAMILALLSMLIVTVVNPYWRGLPFITLTLFLTMLLVPAYAQRLLTRLHRARDAALEANLAKSRFLAQASHDLRQPIHAISLFTACLRDTGLNDEQRQMVANIDRSLNSVSRLFRSLLDLSTLDSGRVSVKAEVVALDQVLKDIVRQNADMAQWANVTLKHMPTKAYVRIDPSLLTTVLQNIVSNAVKYAGGGPVLIGCRRKGGSFAVQVSDRGPGIAQEHLPQLFEEFYQVRMPGDRDIDGVGLGLSIVKRLASLMQLTVTVRSVVGKGTTVMVDGLPLADKPSTLLSPRKSGTSSAINGYRILLVEDDPIVLAATSSLLEKWGCTVSQASGIPQEGSEDCDLIITDFDLGEKTTGSDCIAEIRRRARRDIPAIIMTGHDPDTVRAIAGDSDFFILSKPVRPAELRSVVVAQRFKGQRLARIREDAPHS